MKMNQDTSMDSMWNKIDVSSELENMNKELTVEKSG
jgi:hypothetical protein